MVPWSVKRITMESVPMSIFVNVLLAVILFFFGYILNGLREEIRDLKITIVKHVSDHSIHKVN